MTPVFHVLQPTPAVPWYIHPAQAPLAWQRLAEGAFGFGFVVVNIENGPGRGPQDPYYREPLARGLATTTVGYVNVGYGQRPWGDVLEQVEQWQRWYGIHDVMLDCVPSQDRQGAWSVEWIDALRRAGVEHVIANPGVVPTRRLVETADVTCVAEAAWQDYAHLQMPEWLQAVSPHKQWHLVHGVPPEHLASVPALAASRGAHFSWATDRGLPNPWDVLPAPYADCHPELVKER